MARRFSARANGGIGVGECEICVLISTDVLVPSCTNARYAVDDRQVQPMIACESLVDQRLHEIAAI